MAERSSHSLAVTRGIFLLLACRSTDGPAGSNSADAGVPALISEAEWLAQSAPRTGVHEVWSAACDGVRIAQDYRLFPALNCHPRPNPGAQFSDTLDCVVGDYCETSSDCTAQNGGVCVGSAGSTCEYAGLEEQLCDQDAECVQLPGGTCRPRIAAGQTTCYPTGECRTIPPRSCFYPSLYSSGCRSDAECTAAPGGRCEMAVGPTTCVYNECDDSCGPNARCECQSLRRCVAADCFSDVDCGAGFRCEASLAVQCGNLYPPVGYHCHAERDECQSDADCGRQSCVFDSALSSWTCRTFTCLTR